MTFRNSRGWPRVTTYIDPVVWEKIKDEADARVLAPHLLISRVLEAWLDQLTEETPV